MIDAHRSTSVAPGRRRHRERSLPSPRYQERRRQTMAVEKVGEKYRCNICGNEVVVTEAGGGTLVCCGEDMEKIEG